VKDCISDRFLSMLGTHDTDLRCPAVEDAITCDHQSSLKVVFLRSDDPSRNTGQFIWAMLKFLTKHCIRAGPYICRYLMEMKVTRDFPRAVLYVISSMTGETCHLLSLRSSQGINKQYLPKHQWLAACSHLFIPSFLTNPAAQVRCSRQITLLLYDAMPCVFFH